MKSVFCANHSTETAVIKNLNDLNTDTDKPSALVLLGLSAAFDTVDHYVLLNRLEHWVGFSGTVMKWLRSNLQDRSFFVAIGNYTSTPTSLTCGQPGVDLRGLFNPNALAWTNH